MSETTFQSVVHDRLEAEGEAVADILMELGHQLQGADNKDGYVPAGSDERKTIDCILAELDKGVDFGVVPGPEAPSTTQGADYGDDADDLAAGYVPPGQAAGGPAPDASWGVNASDVLAALGATAGAFAGGFVGGVNTGLPPSPPPNWPGFPPPPPGYVPPGAPAPTTSTVSDDEDCAQGDQACWQDKLHRHAREKPILAILIFVIALWFLFLKDDSIFETVTHSGTKTRSHDRVDTIKEEIHTKRESVLGKPTFPDEK